MYMVFFFQAEDGIREYKVTGVQTCALPISPSGASCSSRLATFTASPITLNSPAVPTVPTGAGPVFTPIRIASAFPDASRMSASASWSPSAARTARSASSSRATSVPQTAISASPMCLSMRPPCSTTTTSSRAHREFMRSITSSASRVSDIAVKPLTSAKSTVTWRRRPSWTGPSWACNAPIVASITSSGTVPRSCSWASMARRSWSGSAMRTAIVARATRSPADGGRRVRVVLPSLGGRPPDGGFEMPVAELDGIELTYELVGEGQPWVLTPGGRFTHDVGGLPEMARALAATGRQVLTWDRPNCGASSVVFDGPSESEVQADALGALLRHLDLGPTVIAGGSGGARVSLLTAARNPDVAAGLAMWWISGGMEAVVGLDQWQETIAKNPRNRDRFLAMRREDFLAVMDRWAVAYCPCEDALVPGLDAADIDRLTVPILVFRSGASDMSHTRATSEALAAGLPGEELVEPPWGDDEWNERRATIEETGSLFVRWPLLVPQLTEWADRSIGGAA